MGSNSRILKILRVLRSLRSFKSITFMSGIQAIIATLINSVPGNNIYIKKEKNILYDYNI